MTLQQYIQENLQQIIEASKHTTDGSPISVSFDLGVTPYEYQDVKSVLISEDSPNKVKFTINIL